ncbi:MAG: translation initiation factor IF-2 [Bacteroidetes bacterium GWF2_42_66]|nr:MAG: translation initiation factor IF-2 [Bacteroidetes bacterium GWA2_42_15]OFX97356.1 MAG: translation initiation factor IF-2 [Bacteroidetes bacterium GWE2_42_39]OFY39993.1 MAG: translation initiation factor IF-2 [Bacteroidetes bacterium GWF2_42_66]HBL78189.1 translation initiation factor IF-2 [Prolixibacteraceae bacterium]HCR89454.1 translation initiation factor IF-2 [Prolixibacteraceae bacterium]
MITGGKNLRLSKVAREFNVGISTIVEFLHKKGFKIDSNPNEKISDEEYHILEKEYKRDIDLKKESEKINLKSHRVKESVTLDDVKDSHSKDDDDDYDDDDEVMIKSQLGRKEELVSPKPVQPKKEEPVIEQRRVEPVKVVGKIDLENLNPEKKKEQPVPEKQPEEIKPAPAPVEAVVQQPKVETPVAPAPVKPPVQEPKREIPAEPELMTTNVPKVEEVKVVGRIDLDLLNQKTRPAKKSKKQKEEERKERERQRRNDRPETPAPEAAPIVQNREKKDDTIRPRVEKLAGPTVVGKIELGKDKPVASSGDNSSQPRKKKRKRIGREITPQQQQQQPQTRVEVIKRGDQPQKGALKKGPEPAGKRKKRQLKKEVSEEDVQKQIKDTLARLTTKTKSKGSKHRRDKRQMVSDRMAAAADLESSQRNILKVTEFVSVAELASMMDVQVTQIISTCMSLGLFVSINQRLDAETMSVVADEFGYKVEFVDVDIVESIEDQNDDQPDKVHPRAPIVTVMGHVDHGKTSLLDYVRSTNVIAGEAGGITQHIGAYHVELKDGRVITFLDTPGHEAFTAMRARGAQITDIVIIVVAADDAIMPQTIEAINHATAAAVPIVFAINKVDKPTSNPEKIKEALANMNFLVEEWGGKYQSQDISAKFGQGVDELLEKVLLEAEMLELKGNKDKKAVGAVIESALDKGRGYMATVLVQNGTLKHGDIVLAGQHFGHVKAMFNERNQRIKEAGPSEPAIILGLDGAPQAGDKFLVMANEREARAIANKREQLAREQGIRTQKHITLDEIGRRIAIGNFQELNLIVKGDVDGSVEALADSLIKLSTEEIQVNVKHKAVGQISESDVLLAAASNAIVVGFQVRPSMQARKLAEKEEIDIRLYSIIYDAINEIKAAMEGMLSPEIKEEITGTAEVMEAFKITKVGTVAGCIVRDGKMFRSTKVRVIRDGIVIYTGILGSLKRFKEDVKEVQKGYECGLNVDGYNDVRVGDHIESFREVEVAKTL